MKSMMIAISLAISCVMYWAVVGFQSQESDYLKRIQGREKGTVFYFHSDKCDDCKFVDQRLLPELISLPQIRTVVKLDVSKDANVRLLVDSASESNAISPVWIFEGRVYDSIEGISQFIGLESRVRSSD